MTITSQNIPISDSQRGATAIIVAILILVLIGFAALVVDLSFAYVTKNRLQNAADSGALAGASVLYKKVGSNLIIDHTDATNKAQEYVLKNINVNTDNITIEIGHWAFGIGDDSDNNYLARDFYKYDGNQWEPIPLGNYNLEQLDRMLNHINAVKVTINGESPTFFSKIWGFEFLQINTDAVAYLGFTGNLAPAEVDFPLILCSDAILNFDGEDPDNLTCGIGRLIHSGQGSGQSNFNTGAWTNYSDICTGQGSWDSNDMTQILNQMNPNSGCTAPNQNPIRLGSYLAAGGGLAANDFQKIGDCTDFFGQQQPTSPISRNEPWHINVLVADCQGANNPGGCLEIVGMVNLTVVLVTSTFPEAQPGTNPYNQRFNYVPDIMAGDNINNFNLSDITGVNNVTGVERWNRFAHHFGLQIFDPQSNEFRLIFPENETDFTTDSTEEYYHQKTIYALPTCTQVDLAGDSTGSFPSMLAKFPVLVD